MDQQEGLSTNRPPLFIGENYAYWSVRMKGHLMSLGWKVSTATEKEYKIDDQEPTDPEELGQYEGYSKSLNAIPSGLTNFVFTKVMRHKTAKQAWDMGASLFDQYPITLVHIVGFKIIKN